MKPIGGGAGGGYMDALVGSAGLGLGPMFIRISSPRRTCVPGQSLQHHPCRFQPLRVAVQLVRREPRLDLRDTGGVEPIVERLAIRALTQI